MKTLLKLPIDVRVALLGVKTNLAGPSRKLLHKSLHSDILIEPY